jgi:hypothetical protein
MKNTTRLILLLSAVTLLAPMAIAQRSVVVDLYKAHDSKSGDPFFQSKSRARVDKFFTKSLADLIWNDSVTSQKNNEVGVIDGDPLYNGQDLKIKKFLIGTAAVKGSTATVPVTFTNYGKKNKLTFSLKKVGSAWKVDDIDYGDPEIGTLRGWFKETN